MCEVIRQHDAPGSDIPIRFIVSDNGHRMNGRACERDERYNPQHDPSHGWTLRPMSSDVTQELPTCGQCPGPPDGVAGEPRDLFVLHQEAVMAVQ